MQTYADKIQENQNKAVTNTISQKKSDNKPAFQFADNRPEAIQMQKLQEIAANYTKKNSFQFVDNRPEVVTQRKLQEMAQNSPHPRAVIQRVKWKELPSEIKEHHSNREGWSQFLDYLFTQKKISEKNDKAFVKFLGTITSPQIIQGLFESSRQFARGEAPSTTSATVRNTGTRHSGSQTPEESSDREAESVVARPASHSEPTSGSRVVPSRSVTESSKISHLSSISDRSVAAFEEQDPMTYQDAGNVFKENSGKYQDILSETKAKEVGYTGIIHFGTNTTRQGTAGVAAKPHAKKHYGGTELTWANNQKMLSLIDTDTTIKTATSGVRKGVNNANISIVRLEVALKNGELIYFHLNQFNQEMIQALTQDNPDYQTPSGFKPVMSVTGQEFIHIHKNWARFSNSVVFLRNLKPVSKPW